MKHKLEWIAVTLVVAALCLVQAYEPGTARVLAGFLFAGAAFAVWAERHPKSLNSQDNQR